MTYVVTESCIKCKYTDCVDVCPVDCFRKGPNMLVIDPDECIDCTLCVPECPVEAIFAEDDVPDAQQEFIAKKAAERAARSRTVSLTRSQVSEERQGGLCGGAKGQAPSHRARRRVPLLHDPMPFIGRKDLKAADRSIRRSNRALQNTHQTRHQSRNAAPVEQVRLGVEPQMQLLARHHDQYSQHRTDARDRYARHRGWPDSHCQ